MKPHSIRNLLSGCAGLLLLFSVPPPTLANPRQSCGDGGIKVELDFAAMPIKTGTNEVTVKLYAAAGQPIGGAKVTVLAAELLQADPTLHDKAESNHLHETGVQLQSNTGCRAETDANNHQLPTQETKHDMVGMETDSHHNMAGMEMDSHHDMVGTETDSHSDMAEIEINSHHQDMAVQAEFEAGYNEGHSGGHGEPIPMELVAGPTLGEYQGQVNFTTEGRWLVKVNFLVLGQAKEEVEFTLDVVKREPNWYVLGGFLSINTLVLAIAAVMKQKTARA